MLQAQKSRWRQEDNIGFWRKIWRIKAPPKVLNFVWRSLSNILPTMVTLQQKCIPVDRVCPVCKRDDETVDHILVRCPMAAQCWQLVILDIQISADDELFHWWVKILDMCDNDRRAVVASICWSIWKARNEVVWNKKFTLTHVVIVKAKQYLIQWRFAQRKLSNTLFPTLVEVDGAETWVAPQESTIKVSVDAATFEELGASGMEMVARDAMGDLIQAKTVYKQGLLSAEMAEAMAIKEALSWIKARAWQRVVIESDCLVAVQTIRSKAPMISPFGQVIMDCRNTIRDLNTVSLFFIRRSANMAAHELARVSYSFPDQVFDRSSVPIGVDIILNAELTY